MKIAVEGMDGVGKSTIAKIISKQNNMIYLEKPLAEIFNSSDNDGSELLSKMCKKIYNFDNEILKAWFFGLGNLYSFIEYENSDVIIDRHFASNYFWNGSERSNLIYKSMIDLIGIPDITIVLYASWETRKKRLMMRNPNDPDLFDCEKMVDGYEKMYKFLDDFSIPYFVINTENKNIEDVVNEVSEIIKEYDSNIKYEEKQKCYHL